MARGPKSRSRRALPLVHAVIGQRLRPIRQVRQLSQARLGAPAGLSRKFIGEVERGEKSISIDSLYRLAVVLRMPLGYLSDVRGPSTADVEALSAMLIALSRSERTRALQVVRAIFATRSA